MTKTEEQAEEEAIFWTVAGQVLRGLREDRGWTQQDLAERANVSYALIPTYEQGGRSKRPSYPEWRKLVAAFGLGGMDDFERMVKRAGGGTLIGSVTPPEAEEGESGPIDRARLFRRLRLIESEQAAQAGRLATIEATLGLDRPREPREPAKTAVADWVPAGV